MSSKSFIPCVCVGNGRARLPAFHLQDFSFCFISHSWRFIEHTSLPLPLGEGILKKKGVVEYLYILLPGQQIPEICFEFLFHKSKLCLTSPL